MTATLFNLDTLEVPPPRFDGADYDHNRDAPRLTGQLARPWFKFCSRCCTDKPESEFYRDRNRLSSKCKVCILRDMKRTPEQIEADRRAQQEADARWLAEYPQRWQELVNSHAGGWPTDESWRPVVGYEGLYEVSDKGRVRSLWFENGTVAKRRHIPHVRKQHTTDFGYRTVNLAKDGEHKTTCVHGIVCEAFHGPAPDGHICGHRDGNPGNNLSENVRWITYSVNNGEDRQCHGTALNGSMNHQAKLTEAAVVDLRSKHAAGASLDELATEFRISKSVASKIVRREAWKHVA